MKPSPMGEDEFRAIIDREVTDAVGWSDSELSSQRIEAMNYYQGEPFGDEREGRSKVVLTEVADAIEFVMPSLVDIFAGTEETWRFTPTSPEDADGADQATEYINHVMNVDNDGFSIIHDSLKDGLLQKVGVAIAWWDESEDVTEEEYEGLTQEELVILTSDPEIEITSWAPAEVEGAVEPQDPMAPPMPPSYDVKVKRKKNTGRVNIEVVPPDEFLISKRAKSMEKARFAGWYRATTVSDLVDEGYDYEEICDHLGTDESKSEEQDTRFRDVDDGHLRDTTDKTMREVMVLDGFIRADFDGDGIAELRYVKCIGSGFHLLENENFDQKPFAMWSPIRMPHRAIGRAWADMLKDLQKIKSTILRQILDSFYLVTNPRPVVGRGVNLDDVLATAPGRPIRADDPTQVVWQQGRGLGGEGFPLLEYMDGVREQRTGMNKASAGLDPDVLQKTTAYAMAAHLMAAQGRLKLIARIYGENFLRQMAKVLLRLVTKHQQKPRMIRLRNQWVPMDPRAWKNEYDVMINVGLGTGQVAERIGMLAQIAAKQELIIKTLGPNNEICPVNKYVYTLRRMVEIAGFRDTDRFFADLPEGAQIQTPDPGQAEAQAKMAEAQGKLQVAQAAAQGKLQLQAASAEQAMQLKREANAADLAMEKEKMLADFLLRRQEMDREFTLRMREMGLQAAVGMENAKVSTNLPRAS